MKPIYVDLSQRPRRRRAGADRRRDPGRDRVQPGGAGPRRNGDRAAHAPRSPTPRCTATSTCCAALSARRSTSRASRSSATIVDNYQHGPAVGAGDPQPVRPATGVPKAMHRRQQHHRHAHRRRHRDRRQVPRAQGQQGARPYRRARHGLLERAPARPAVRFRRDPRAFAPAGKPRRLRRAAVDATSASRSIVDRGLGILRRRAPTSWSRPRA